MFFFLSGTDFTPLPLSVVRPLKQIIFFAGFLTYTNEGDLLQYDSVPIGLRKKELLLFSPFYFFLSYHLKKFFLEIFFLLVPLLSTSKYVSLSIRYVFFFFLIYIHSLILQTYMFFVIYVSFFLPLNASIFNLPFFSFLWLQKKSGSYCKVPGLRLNHSFQLLKTRWPICVIFNFGSPIVH